MINWISFARWRLCPCSSSSSSSSSSRWWWWWCCRLMHAVERVSLYVSESYKEFEFISDNLLMYTRQLDATDHSLTCRVVGHLANQRRTNTHVACHNYTPCNKVFNIFTCLCKLQGDSKTCLSSNRHNFGKRFWVIDSAGNLHCWHRGCARSVSWHDLLEDKELAADVTHERQLMLSQKHVMVIRVR